MLYQQWNYIPFVNHSKSNNNRTEHKVQKWDGPIVCKTKRPRETQKTPESIAPAQIRTESGKEKGKGFSLRNE